MTGREIWRQMTQFWGMLFGINFAMGVATGITMEFQFGMNWAYYSPLRRRHLRRAAGDRRPDGVLPRSRPSSACSSSAGSASRSVSTSARHLAGRARLQLLGAVDPDRQRLDAEPGRRALQPRNDAHGGDVVQRGDLQSGGAGQVRAHGRCRLRDRRGVRAGDLGVVPAATSATVALRVARWRWRRASASPRRCRSSCSATSRVCRHRAPEDEARRDRGDVAHRAAARAVHGLRLSRCGGAQDARRGAHSLAAGPDRHALDRQGSAGHLRARGARAPTHRKRRRGPPGAAAAARRSQRHEGSRGVRGASGRILATACCCCALRRIRPRPLRPTSSRQRG